MSKLERCTPCDNHTGIMLIDKEGDYIEFEDAKSDIKFICEAHCRECEYGPQANIECSKYCEFKHMLIKYGIYENS